MSPSRRRGGGQLRDNCLNCARKHLASALIIALEVRVGALDIHHKWLVIGHISEAEVELVIKWPHLALELREHRKAYEDDGDYILPLMDYIRRIGDEESLPSV